LREAARAAQAEQRMYAPSGNNAMEYYLALRDKQPNDAAVASALTDLMPYALIAAEQSIARDDFAEAQRLYALMEKTDKAAPALPRLKQSLTDAQSSFAQRQQQQEVDAETEKARLAKLEEDRKKAQEETQRLAAERLAQQQQQQAAAAAQAQREAADREAAQRAAAQREAAQREAAEREAAARAAAAQPAAASANDLRAISTPPPKYPPEALRAGTSGEVLVEFTVATDGSVSSARVVRGNPPRVFDREAVAAVKRWRYQPVASPVTTRRTIGFKPGG
jgi:protein TonB